MKIRTILIVLVTVFFLVPGGLNGENTKSLDFDFGIKIGAFSLNDKELSEVYSSGFVFGIEGIFWSQSGFGLGLNIDRYGDSETLMEGTVFGTSIDIKSEISIIPVTVTALYRMKKQDNKIYPYFGIGTGFYSATEKLISTVGNDTKTSSNSADGFGIQLLGGMQIYKLYLELKYSSANAKFTWEEEEEEREKKSNTVDIGGVNFLIGFRF